MKKILYTMGVIIMITTLFTACKTTGLSQSEKKEKADIIAQKINNKDFVFEAQDALPMGGRTLQLTSYYDLKVSKDTLYSSLPYFGRAYSAPLNPSEGGYMFTSTQFDYQVGKQDNSWNITLVPKDRHNGEKFNLTAFSNGSANLQVTSNDRQPITFRGRIKF